MAGGLKVPLIIDKEGGTKELNSWLASTEAEIPVDMDLDPAQEAVKETESAFKALGQTGADQLGKIEDEAKKTGDATKNILSKLTMQDAIGGLSDFKDIIDKTGVSVFGLSEESVKAASATSELAAKGASALSVFGPMGAAIGGVVGGLLGYISSTNDAEAATRKLIQAEKDKLEQDKLRIGQFDLSADLKKLAAVTRGDEFGLKGKSYEELNKLYTESKIRLADLATQAEKAGTKLGEMTTAQKVSAAIFGDANLESKYLRENIAEETKKRDALKKAIDDDNKALEAFATTTEVSAPKVDKVTKSIKGATNAANDFAKQFDTLTDSVIGSLGRDGVEAAQKLNEELGTGRRIVETTGEHLLDISRNLEHISTIALPEFKFPDPGQIDPLRSSIQGLFGAITTEGSNADIALQSVTDSLRAVGNAAANAIGGAATSAFGDLFEALATNEKQLESFGKAFARKAGEALRATGSELIGDGIANELKALAMAFVPGMQGPAAGLAAAGAVEIAAGLAMGGVGIGLGKAVGAEPAAPKAGSSSTAAESQGFSGGPGGQTRAFATDVKAAVIINISGVPFGAMTLREMEAIGGRIAEVSAVHSQNGGSIRQ